MKGYASLPTVALCRKHGLSSATFFKPKAKYGGMDLPDTKRLKQLEDGNATLKNLEQVSSKEMTLRKIFTR